MRGVGGRDHVPQQAVGLYPTSGASDDDSPSRWYKNKKLNQVYGYTMEFGYAINFFPTPEEYIQNILDTSAGFKELCSLRRRSASLIGFVAFMVDIEGLRSENFALVLPLLVAAL